jgi:hypothetical protein
MGKILINTDDEMDPKKVDRIEKAAKRILGDEYQSINWYWNGENEDEISALMEKLIEENCED